MFECFKGVLLQSHPDPGFILSSEEIEGGNNVQEVWYEFSVEVGKSCKGSYGFNGRGRFQDQIVSSFFGSISTFP